MPYSCSDVKNKLTELAGKGLSDKAKLVAILEACGITDREELEALLECKPSTLRQARQALKIQRQKSSTAENPAPEIQRERQNSSETPEIQRQNSSALACATKELPSVVVISKNNTPGDAREGLDEAWANAMQLGNQIKGGKVAKSARAQAKFRGELDGSQGITFTELGEIVLGDDVIAELRKKFPSVDLEAVCDKAAPELAKMSYPSKTDALTILRKWARIETQNASRSKPSNPGQPLEHRIPENVVKFARPVLDEVANA